MGPKSNEGRKSIIVVPSRVISRPDECEGGEETEIAAQITVPKEGGWGWIVVFTAFTNIFILDGVTFTFGSMLTDMAKDLQQPDSLIALINSIAVALYFIVSPLASALINRFGFRACSMTGSVICSISLLSTYFAKQYIAVCLFYGVFAGIGYALINMSSGLVVGFYFEKKRSIALSFSSCGSSIGITTLSPVNSYLVNLSGWRTTTLLHSGFFGLIFFLSMTFRPLLSITVTKTETDPTRTVTYLPSLASSVRQLQSASKISNKKKENDLVPTATERMFNAVSNINFPTAAAVIEDDATQQASIPGQPGPSVAAGSRLTFTFTTPAGAQQQLKEVQSNISRTASQVIVRELSETLVRKRKWWQRLCQWESHLAHTRPMYRDDAFYDGKIEMLRAYQKQMTNTSGEVKTGLEYQMAVSRAVAVTDLHEKRGLFTTSIRRVLATMMDPNLLKRSSFILLCSSGFLTYLGLLVPYVYLKDRNLHAGLEPKYCAYLISIIGLSNAIGRLVLGSLASKIDPIKLFSFWISVAGVSTMVSGVSHTVYFQFAYCSLFGFSVACVACLRSLILVSIYGLDKLTNATGMMLIFLGIGNLFSTPIAGLLKNNFGYDVAFCIAGVFITCSGLILIPVRRLTNKENKVLSSVPTSDAAAPLKKAPSAPKIK